MTNNGRLQAAVGARRQSTLPTQGTQGHGVGLTNQTRERGNMLDKTKSKITKAEMIPYSNSTAISTGRVIITVDGIKPLLTHNPQSMGQSKGPGKGSRIPESDVEAESGVYRMDDGSCAIKGEAFRMSGLSVSGDWKTKGRKTMKGQLAHIVVVEEPNTASARRSFGSPNMVITASRSARWCAYRLSRSKRSSVVLQSPMRPESRSHSRVVCVTSQGTR